MFDEKMQIIVVSPYLLIILKPLSKVQLQLTQQGPCKLKNL